MDTLEELRLKVKKATDEQIRLLIHNSMLRKKTIANLETKVLARDKRIAELEQKVENLENHILELGERME